MNLNEAIEIRCSRRKYLDKKIEPAALKKLKMLIEGYNSESGLNIKLIVDEPEAFNGFKKTYGLLVGVTNYFCMISNKTIENCNEKLGYYGELLVLHATAENLGTCWVGGSYDKNLCPVTLSDNEKINCVISVGYCEKNKNIREKFIYGVTHRKSKTASQMYESDIKAPDWFLRGMDAVVKAPSAVNRQGVKFRFQKGKVTAEVDNIEDSSKAVDLGIAKLHFEIGAKAAGVNGKWTFGNKAEFILIK